MKLFDLYSEELYKYLKNKEPNFIRNFEYIMAQWCYESGYFTSKLAVKYNNVCGLKYRGEIKDKVPTMSSCDYTDWEKESDSYASVSEIKYFPILYFEFIKRWPYSGYEKFAGNGAGFINHIADCNFCGSISTVKKDFFLDREKYQDAVNTEYFRHIKMVYESDKFNKLMTNFIRKNINIYCLKELSLEEIKGEI